MVNAIKSRFLWLLRRRRGASGQTLVEYAMIIAFVATMVVALAVVVGGINGEGGLLPYIRDQLESALG